MADQRIEEIARSLYEAERRAVAIPPVVTEIGAGDVAAAYEVQSLYVERSIREGRRLVGRKAGLTSKAVQSQLGVDQPDYGALFSDMEVDNGGICEVDRLIQPRVEAEVAFVMGRAVDDERVPMASLLRSIDFALPALEIVDSRVADWKISIVDTIADNGSSARFVLGNDPRLLTSLGLATVGMMMTRNGETISTGSGAACLGHPLQAALWLARTLAAAGSPLREGDVLLTGALGPMVPVKKGERYEAFIAGFEPVSVSFG